MCRAYSLGERLEPSAGKARVTVTFAVGGAGAQTEIGQMLALSLRPGILEGRFRLILVAGVNRAVQRVFREAVARAGLESALGEGVVIVCEDSKHAYFDRFNALMRETDILWTKPSELSFYSGLGLPIVMARCGGSCGQRGPTPTPTSTSPLSTNAPIRSRVATTVKSCFIIVVISSLRIDHVPLC